jgi:predicted PurR-regulated permease PerM
MARIVSFVVLVVILLVLFGLFFQVMADFLLPMFLAVLLVIMFGPVHRWFKARCKSHDRLAALLTTLTISLSFFLPASFILFRAAKEGRILYLKAVDGESEGDSAAKAAPAQSATVAENPAKTAEKGLTKISKKIADRVEKMGLQLKPEDIESTLRTRMKQYLTPAAVSTGQFLAKFLMGFFVMLLAIYYFLADGPAMVRAFMRLSPLEDKYESQLIDQFGNVTQAVVLATFLSALAQGLLAGIGFYFAGVEAVFLLTVLAMLFAVIPFIGAAGVWLPVCLWMLFVEEPPRTGAAIGLAIYCIVVVSMVDNVIKPFVLHGRSNIHPLLALLSVLGGAEALGPIGILVGPMAVAFLQTLLEMVNKEMTALGKMKEEGKAMS